MRTKPHARRPGDGVSTREACELAGIHRVTLWKWIYEDGLRFWRDPEYPHGYYYSQAELREMKLRRGARKIVRPRRPADVYDYD